MNDRHTDDLQHWRLGCLLVFLLGTALTAGAFQLSDITGLQLWVRADAGVTRDPVGRVTALLDQSGKGHDFTQPVAALQPRLVESINAKPAIRFDGVDDDLALATPLPLAGTSVIAVVKWNQARTYSFALGCGEGTDGYLRLHTPTSLLTGGHYPLLYQNSLPYRDHGPLSELTRARLIEGKFTEAEELARECLAIREKEIPDDWRTFNARSMLGGSLLGQKKYAEAEPLLLSGYAGMRQREDKIPQQGKPHLKETLRRLVQLYEATSRPDQAAEWKQKLVAYDKTKN